MRPFLRLKQLVMVPLSVIAAIFLASGYLFSVLIALFTFNRHSDWKILYRAAGSFDRESRMRVSGANVAKPIMFETMSGHQYLAQGELDVALAPSGTILFELMQKDCVCEFKLDLSEVLTEPLLGYIEVQVDNTEVRVTVHRYQWGREVSFNNGGSYRRTKRLFQKTYPWMKTSRSIEVLQRKQYEEGGLLDIHRFNAQFRDA